MMRAGDVLVRGLPPWAGEINPGEAFPVAMFVHGDVGLVLYIRRWTDGSHHAEMVRCFRHGPEHPWDPDATTAIPIDDAVLAEDHGLNTVVIHYSEESEGTASARHYMAGLADRPYDELLVRSDVAAIDVAIESPVGAWIAWIDVRRSDSVKLTLNDSTSGQSLDLVP